MTQLNRGQLDNGWHIKVTGLLVMYVVGLLVLHEIGVQLPSDWVLAIPIILVWFWWVPVVGIVVVQKISQGEDE